MWPTRWTGRLCPACMSACAVPWWILIFLVSAGLHDEERAQEEKLDRALVPAAAQLYLLLRERGPDREERRHPARRELLCGGQLAPHWGHDPCSLLNQGTPWVMRNCMTLDSRMPFLLKHEHSMSMSIWDNDPCMHSLSFHHWVRNAYHTCGH